MQRERVTDDIYVFRSNLYVQVTAGVVITNVGAVVIDTLLYPEESLAIKRYVEERLGTAIRYVINTHFHADHSTGTCFFEDAQIISHRLCRQLLDTRGRAGLKRSKESSAEMQRVELVLPQIVFDDRMSLQLGNKTLTLWSTPGHSDDSVVCLVEEDQVLFAADTVMALPYFVDGSYEGLLASLHGLQGQGFESIIQGHGEVILRGEVESKITADINYLGKLRHSVDNALSSRVPERALESIDVEACGKSRILLNGAVQQLHRQNVLALANLRREQMLLQTE